MNDASPRFAEAQTGAPLLLSTEDGAVSLTKLTRRASELSVWFTEEGLRGATAGELFEGYCERLSAMDFVIMRAYPDLAPPMDWVWPHMATEFSSVREQQFARGPISHEWTSSPFNALIQRSLAGEKNPWLRDPQGGRPRRRQRGRAPCALCAELQTEVCHTVACSRLLCTAQTELELDDGCRTQPALGRHSSDTNPSPCYPSRMLGRLK
jgi:hypothetical protein